MRQKITILFAVLVIVGLVVVYLWSGRDARDARDERGAPVGGEPKLNYAPVGELTPSFPKEFILDDEARLKRSYSIDYSEGANQYTASFTSEKTLEDLAKEYKDYFSRGDWSIVNETANPGSYGLYLSKDRKDVSLVILDGKKARQVMISYLVPR